MKHIVFVIGNYKNGGVAMRSTNLANAFAEKKQTKQKIMHFLTESAVVGRIYKTLLEG